MKLWTVTTDTDDDLETHVFTSRADAVAFRDAFHAAYGDPIPADEADRDYHSDGHVISSITEHTLELTPTVEVLHDRDPDSFCHVGVYVDGVEVTPRDLADIDPGRGGSAAVYQRTADAYRANKDGLSPAYAAAAADAYDRASGSKHLDEDDE